MHQPSLTSATFSFRRKYFPLCLLSLLWLQNLARSGSSLRRNASRFMPHLPSLHLPHPVNASSLYDDLPAFLAWSWHDLKVSPQQSCMIATALHSHCQSPLSFNTSSYCYRTILTELFSSHLHYSLYSLHLLHILIVLILPSLM